MNKLLKFFLIILFIVFLYHLVRDILQILGIENIIEYRIRCSEIRNFFGLRKSVALVDMSWVVRKEPGFFATLSKMRALLRQAMADVPAINVYMDSLRRGMLFNVPFPEYSFQEFLSLANLPADQLPALVKERAHSITIEYAAFLLTMHYLRIISRAFPAALRATVHPKHAPQLPIHLVNNSTVIFPYNGIPAVSESKLHRSGDIKKSATILRYYELFQQANVRAVHLQDSDYPLYYLI